MRFLDTTAESMAAFGKTEEQMDEQIYDALVELKASIDKQNEIAEQQLATTKALIGVIQESAQASADLAEMLKARSA